ncbi:MAG: polyprenol monophosphomannose synthase [Methanosarcinaceae archaeon]|nr:polyprenol monophosphomannose synthase [Methanosarcinaceae archaeon]
MLSVVIPTYNESMNITKLVTLIDSILVENEIDGEIIVVDDNSPDGTGDVVRELMVNYPHLRLLSRKKKEGLGVAHMAGYAEAHGDIIVSLDADLSHDPREIPVMLNRIKDGFDMVIGSRYVKGGKVVEKPLFNVIASKVAGILAKVGFGVNIDDFTNGYRMFKKEIYESIKTHDYSKGNVFLAEFVYYAHKNGYKVIEIPTTFVERSAGETKTNVMREAKALIRSIIRVRMEGE